MVYTVTLNPSIDYVMRVASVESGKTNRADMVEYIAGGKGINVSRMLNNLGIENTAIGVLAGDGGKWFENIVKCYGIKTSFFWLYEGNTRINVKIKEKTETEINASGPTVSKDEEALFLESLSKIGPGDIVVLAGSVAPGFSSDIYERIIEKLEKTDVPVIVDTTGNQLKNILKYRPLLVKPNAQELGELYGVKICGPLEAVTYGQKLVEQGARNVIVSMGKDGAVMITEQMSHFYVPAVRGPALNSVGAGDSMVGGFLYGYGMGWEAEEILKMAVACGCASTFSCEIATKKEAEKIKSLLTVQ